MVDIIREESGADELAWQAEYIGTKCTECETEITADNNNGDGLCTKCMYDALQNHCS